MLSKAKHLFFFFLVGLLLSSCISIEKRRYRDGFHIEQNIFHAKKSKEQEMKSVVHTPNLDFIPLDSFAVTQVEIEKIVPEITTIKKYLFLYKDNALKTHVALKDTLPEKKKKRDAPQKDDERKDVTQDHRKLSSYGIAALLLSLISLACFTGAVVSVNVASLLFVLLWYISLVVSFICTVFASKQIKNKPDEFYGFFLVIASRIILSVSFLYILFK